MRPGSMSGNGWGYGSESPTTVSRIDKVRSALTKVLPSITRFRRVGLITYGPGPYNQCNVRLNLKPTENAADRIMREVNALVPAGRTPLTSAVEQAANVLDFREKPGLIVVLTDGEETCGRSTPCDVGKELHAAGRAADRARHRLAGEGISPGQAGRKAFSTPSASPRKTAGCISHLAKVAACRFC